MGWYERTKLKFFLKIAHGSFVNNDFQRAILRFRKVLAFDDSPVMRAVCCSFVGRSYLALNEWEKARQYLVQAHALMFQNGTIEPGITEEMLIDTVIAFADSLRHVGQTGKADVLMAEFKEYCRRRKQADQLQPIHRENVKRSGDG